MDIKEEITELVTIQIALDDKIHKMLFDLKKVRDILENVDKRIKKIKEMVYANEAT